MYKIWIAAYKEILLLKRDLGGLVILFLMPLVLVITVTIIQDSTFKRQKQNIPVLLVDQDKDSLSAEIVKNLEANESFDLVQEIEGIPVDETQANDLVLKGRFQLAIVIPEGLTRELNKMVEKNINEILNEFGVGQDSLDQNQGFSKQEVKLCFDPAVNPAFKSSVKSGIENLIAQLENKAIYEILQRELEIEEKMMNSSNLISFLEINPRDEFQEIKPNSAQHNVPAWSLFAIFFIIIPLSINIVQEKNQGTFVRLKTNPVSYASIMGSKVLVYLLVCVLQFILLLLVGIYLFPHIGLPAFRINGSYGLLFLVAVFSGLGAIGIGILLGTIAKTQEQSAPFGATFVVILAAIGGIWIPVFVMPEFMQYIAVLSPMNWGLNAFYDVIIRNGSFIDVLPELTSLGLFFIVMMLLSVYADKLKYKF